MLDSQCSSFAERRIHYNYIVLVIQRIVLKCIIQELSAQAASLQLQLREETLTRFDAYHFISLRHVSCDGSMTGTRLQYRVTFTQSCPFYHLVTKRLWGREVVATFTIVLV